MKPRVQVPGGAGARGEILVRFHHLKNGDGAVLTWVSLTVKHYFTDVQAQT